MQVSVKRNYNAEGVRSVTAGAQASALPRVVVCVNSSANSAFTIPPAKAVAAALNAELVFVYVMEAREEATESPLDPVEWEVARQKAQSRVTALIDEHAIGDLAIKPQILEGRCAEQICNTLSGTRQDVVVICTRISETGSRISKVARDIIEAGSSSILIVPASKTGSPKRTFSKIIVPLDGSGEAESAIGIALKIAKSQDAELILCHAVPEPNFTQFGPIEPKDEELRRKVCSRNERVGRTYLDQLGARLRASGARVDTIVLSDGDPRRNLASVITEQSSDLIVMASHGHSGFADVPYGDVANFLMNRSSSPVLMVRRARANSTDHIYSDTQTKGTRRPDASQR